MTTCFVIPVFNHGVPLGKTLARLQTFQLPLILVDDGSGEATRQQIDELAREYTFTLIRLPKNTGKGGAVSAGLIAADAQGFTHALQVDADGQHDLNDVPALLAESARKPEALITGTPLFDDSVPASRLYGRRLTAFFVALETLSSDMPDTMCGFRVYPLTTTIPLLVDRKIGMRMDFDIEVAVRMQWRGTEIVTVPTAVIYPPDGTSNFHMLGDNWLITKLHTRLVIGMLLRLPRVAGRKVLGGDRHWSGIRERGGIFGMRLLFAVYRTFGHRAFLFLLYPVIGYFYLTSPRARKASEEFLDRVAKRRHDLEPQSGSPEAAQQLRTTSTFRHLLDFGRAVLDKGAVWVGSFPAERIQFDDVSVYERFRAENRGSMFIGSHLGNIELLRGLGESKHDLIVNALVFTRHSEKFNRMLESVSPEATKRMIQVDALGPGSVETLARRLAAGEHVAMVADRTSVRHRERSVYAEFLGKPAPFPEGPFILAHLLRCPVYLLFCLRIDGAYRIFLEPFSPRLELPRANRREALQAVVERYASRLEHHCLLAPTQWFNFFDFWAQAEDSGKE